MIPTPGPVELLYVAAYLAIMVVVGYAAVSAVVRDAQRHWLEVAGLSIAAGMALTAWFLLLASAVGLRPGRGALATWGLAAAGAAAAVLWRRGRLLALSVPGKRRRLDPAGVVGLLAAATLLAGLANAVAAASTPGLGDIDEYATWMFRAKVLAVQPLRPIPAALLDPGLSYSHQDYPPLLPLLAAGTYGAVGRIDESAAKLLLVPMYVALLGIVYGAARRELRRAVAVAVTALVVAGPVVVQKAGLAVGELPVTLFLAGATSMLSRWADRRERGDLLLCGGFAAAAAFSKNEGLALLPAFALVPLVVAARARRTRPRRRLKHAEDQGLRLASDAGVAGAPGRDPGLLRDWVLAAAVATILIGPWLIYRRGLPKTHEDYGGKFADPATLARGLARLPHVLVNVASSMLELSTAGPVWIVLAVAVAVGWRAWRRGSAVVVWAVLLAQLGLYVAAFLVTPWDVDELLRLVTSKLLAQSAPAAGVLIALHLQASGFGGEPSTPAPAHGS